MTGKAFFARAESPVRRARMMITGAFALGGMLLPAAAWGLDRGAQQIVDHTNHLLLPPILYLDFDLSLYELETEPAVIQDRHAAAAG